MNRNRRRMKLLSATLATALMLGTGTQYAYAKEPDFQDEYGATIKSTQKVEGTDYTAYMLENNCIYIETDLKGDILYNVMCSKDGVEWSDMNAESEPDNKDTWFSIGEHGYCLSDMNYQQDDSYDYAKVQLTEKTGDGYAHEEELVLKYNDFSKAYDGILARNRVTIDEVKEISRTENEVKLKVKASTPAGSLKSIYFNNVKTDIEGKSFEHIYTLTYDSDYEILVYNEAGFSAEYIYSLKWFDTLEKDAELPEGKEQYIPADDFVKTGSNWDITCSKVPSSATDPFNLTIKATKPVTITVNNTSYSSRKEVKYPISSNGVYKIVATDNDGNVKTKTVTVKAFKSVDMTNHYSDDTRYSGTTGTQTEAQEMLPQTGGLKPVFMAGGFGACALGGIAVLWKRKRGVRTDENK